MSEQGPTDWSEGPSGRPTCSVIFALVATPVGLALVGLGTALETPDELIGLGSTLAGLGGLLAFGGLGVGCFEGCSRLLTRRGSIVREALVAAGATALPCLILSSQLLRDGAVRRPELLAPGWVIPPRLALIGTVAFAGWLAVFAWRVRRPAPGADET